MMLVELHRACCGYTRARVKSINILGYEHGTREEACPLAWWLHVLRSPLVRGRNSEKIYFYKSLQEYSVKKKKKKKRKKKERMC